jgi:PAS domain S-box-containing protein
MISARVELALRRDQLQSILFTTGAAWGLYGAYVALDGRMLATALQLVGLAGSWTLAWFAPRLGTGRAYVLSMHAFLALGCFVVAATMAVGRGPMALPPAGALLAPALAAFLLGTREAVAWGAISMIFAVGAVVLAEQRWMPSDGALSSVDALTPFWATHGVMTVLAWVARRALDRNQRSLAQLNAELEARVASRTAALRESEERFRRLFQAAPEALLMLDDSGRVLQANRAASDVFGASWPELQGADVARLLSLEARSWSQLGSASIGDAELEGLRLDGRAFAAEVALAAIEVDGQVHTLASVKDVSERRAAAQALQTSLSEKETLLREVHHRVKNNLQIVSSLLMLQSEQMPGEESRALLTESVNRVRSMALIHQQLYGLDSLARVDLGAYARMLSGSLSSMLAPRARVEVEVEGLVEVSVEQAVPVGLILNELFTNACKYGLRSDRAEGEACDVRIRLEGEERELRLVVEDRGPGLPPGFELAQSRSLGMVLVRNLARQLRGRAELESRGGTRATLTWPRERAVEATRTVG